MAITIREATDADIPRFVETEIAAYSATPRPSGTFLFPGPFPSDELQVRIQQTIESRKDLASKLMVAIDEKTGEQMAFCKWCFYKTEEDVKSAPPRIIPSGQGINTEACQAFYAEVIEKKKQIIGNSPHVYLRMMHTDPKYQRRGAASALLRWGLQRADELNLPTYLESSATAHQLYKKHGFKDVATVDVDLTPFGGEGLVHSSPCMLREPSKISA